MKSIFRIIILLLILTNCNQEKLAKQNGTPIKYCKNEQKLLSSFDTIPTYKGDFKHINDSLSQKMLQLFGKDKTCCNNLRFNIFNHVETHDSVKISINNKCFCYNGIIVINCCSISQSSKGIIIFEDKIIALDSLSQNVYKHYTNIDAHPRFLDNYRRTELYPKWNDNVPNEKFSKFVDQIIQGYLTFVDEYTKKKYNKTICELSHKELVKIANEVPLNIILPTQSDIKIPE